MIKRTSDHVRERMAEKYGAIANQEIYLNSTYLTTVSERMARYLANRGILFISCWIASYRSVFDVVFIPINF